MTRRVKQWLIRSVTSELLQANNLSQTGCRIALLAAMLNLFTACSFLPDLPKLPRLITWGDNNGLRTIVIEASPDSNLNTPVAVDLVFVADADITPLLEALSGPEWFTRKQELMIRYGEDLSIVSLEVVPLSLIKTLTLPSDVNKAEGILLFANYRSIDGQYVARLSSYKELKIRLETDQYTLTELDN